MGHWPVILISCRIEKITRGEVYEKKNNIYKLPYILSIYTCVFKYKL